MIESLETLGSLAPTRVLVVDDDPSMVTSLTDLLSDEGFDVTATSSGESALEEFREGRFTVAIVDHFLPDMTGTELLSAIRASADSCPVIVYTGYGSLDSAKAAVNLGAFAYVEKVEPAELLRFVHLAARAHILRRSDSLQAEVEERDESLRKSEARFLALAEVAPVGIFHTDREGKYRYVNEQWCSIAGCEREDALGDGWIQAVHPDDRSAVLSSWRLMAETNVPFHAEYRFLRNDRSTAWVIGRAAPQRAQNGDIVGHIGTITDITERKVSEDKLRASLMEKEVLLKEIHHRVKNNLQVVSSLINLQARSIRDPVASRHFEESRNRIKSMALIHEQLYQSADFGRVEFARYVRELTTHLSASFGLAPERFDLDFELHPVDLSLEVAIPCGLLINELVSNALEHAFEDRSDDAARPRVLIALSTDGASDEQVTLRVEDNGVGFPEGLDPASSATLGLKLVSTLTRQIRGTLRIERDGGAKFRIDFPVV